MRFCHKCTTCGLPFVCSGDWVSQPFLSASLDPLPSRGEGRGAGGGALWVRGCQQVPVIDCGAPEALCAPSWGGGALSSQLFSRRAEAENGARK